MYKQLRLDGKGANQHPILCSWNTPWIGLSFWPKFIISNLKDIEGPTFPEQYFYVKHAFYLLWIMMSVLKYCMQSYHNQHITGRTDLRSNNK